MRSALDYRLGLFAILCAIAGCGLVILDLAETPRVFENLVWELALFAPIVVWLAGRRLRLWP